MARDALGAHARDELGMSQTTRARPIQAALSSAAAFATGAFPPLLLVLLVPLRVAIRVTFWGAVALGATALVGRVFGTVAA